MTLDWPPPLAKGQIEALSLEANTFALSKGLSYLPTPGTGTDISSIPVSAIHAPYTLLPTSFPRQLFRFAQRLQPLYNVLYSRIASDFDLLDRIMGAEIGVGRVDDFIGTLWQGWKDLRDLGEGGISQASPLQLGLFRSDYLLHEPSASNDTISLKQVEFNTMASSFGSLSSLVSSLHRHLYNIIRYNNLSPSVEPSDFPPNDTVSNLANGLAEAHRAYNVANSYILMVVQNGERNIFDQRHLEYTLYDKHHIQLIRLTFEEIAHSYKVDSTIRILTVTHPISSLPLEISVVYYRAGYAPSDYPTSKQYSVRFDLERSGAIKCPSIPLQLAGGKKVQEYITQPGVLESLMSDVARWGPHGVFTQDDLEDLRRTWMGMWALDVDGGIERVTDGYDDLVLKPQREGGGNNIYREAIPEFIKQLPTAEREAWIAMQLIHPPGGVENLLLKAGESVVVRKEVVSELGIFGWSLFGGDLGVLKHEEAGWLVRTKGKESDEGGVVVGFSVLDSILLVD